MIALKVLLTLLTSYLWAGFILFFACWVTGSFRQDLAGRSIGWRLQMFACFMAAWPLGVWDYLCEKAGRR